MSVTANWVAMGVHAAGFLATGAFLRPAPGSFEQDLGWSLTALGFLANTVRFLAEALKFGRWPEAPVAYATNWVRYTGAGVGTTFFLGALAALWRGGVTQFICTVLGVAGYYALLVFAALAFETNSAVIGFYTIAATLFVIVTVLFYLTNTSCKSYGMWVPVISFLLEAGFIAMAGIELFRRDVASNQTEDIVFAAISCAKGLWALIVYLGGVKGTWLGMLAAGEPRPVVYNRVSTTVYDQGAAY